MKKLKSKFQFLSMAVIFLAIALSSCKKAAKAATALRTKEIVLTATPGSHVRGKAVIAENADHSFNVQITLQGTVKDTVHVMHIHNGSVTSAGNISVPLSSIKGTGGQATGKTLNIKTATSTSGATVNITYDSIIKPTRYFNIHYSTAQINKIVANGNIQ